MLRPSDTLLLGLFLYALLAMAGVIIASTTGADLWVTPAAVGLPAESRLPFSVGIGLLEAVLGVTVLRYLHFRSKGLRRLGDALGPAVRSMGPGAALTVAVCGAVAEEIFFRGALQPHLGVVGSAVIFAAVHQVGGKARVPWMAASFVAGLAFALCFWASGHLAGSLVAHVALNVHGVLFLRGIDAAVIRPTA